MLCGVAHFWDVISGFRQKNRVAGKEDGLSALSVVRLNSHTAIHIERVDLLQDYTNMLQRLSIVDYDAVPRLWVDHCYMNPQISPAAEKQGYEISAE